MSYVSIANQNEMKRGNQWRVGIYVRCYKKEGLIMPTKNNGEVCWHLKKVAVGYIAG